jgi:ribosome-binding factor A
LPNNASRAGRIADQIQRELAQLISNELKDPRIGLVTITDVEVTADYSHARVFVTTLSMGENAAESALEGLRRASGFLRSRLASSLRTRTVPQLHFVYDESVERGTRLSRLIDEAVGKSHDDV